MLTIAALFLRKYRIVLDPDFTYSNCAEELILVSNSNI